MFKVVVPWSEFCLWHHQQKPAEASGSFDHVLCKTWCITSVRCVRSSWVKTKTQRACTTRLYSRRNNQELKRPTGAKIIMHTQETLFMASPSKNRWSFWIVLTWVAPSFVHNLMHYLCSMRSVNLSENKNPTSVHVSTLGVTTRNWSGLPLQKLSCMHRKGWGHFPLKWFCPRGISFGGRKYFLILFERNK